MAPEKCEAFGKIAAGCPCAQIGGVTDTGRVVIKNEKDKLIDVSIVDAKSAWRGTFDW